MKTLFIELQKKEDFSEKELISSIKELPKDIFIAYSIQYKKLSEKIKKLLSNKITIKGFQQVLGCSIVKTNCNNILLVGSGKFHALNLRKQGKNLWIFENNRLKKLDEADFNYFKKQKIALLNYYNSDKIGILVSTKLGQENLRKAIDFKKTCKKQSYIFIANNINLNEFQNFPQIKSFVNTSCPGLAYDSVNIINIRDII